MERPRTRLLLAVGIGLAFCAFTYLSLSSRPRTVQGGDFTYASLAARFIWRGIDPYRAMPTADTPFDAVMFYPLTAGVVAMPLAWFSPALGGTLLVGLGTGLLAFLVTKREMWRLLMFASAPAYMAMWSVQWSPFSTGAALFPPLLGVALCVKPNLALPLLAYQTSRPALWYPIGGGLVILAVSLVLQPTWPFHWVETLRSHPDAASYRVPILTPLGVPLALAALKWRRPEARLLLGFACIPQAGFFYEQLPLLLVPGTRREMLVMVVLSQLALLVPSVVTFSARTMVEHSTQFMPLIVASLYLPALVMLLRRPNRT